MDIRDITSDPTEALIFFLNLYNIMSIHLTVHAHTFLSSPLSRPKTPPIYGSVNPPPPSESQSSSRVRVGNTGSINHRSLRSKTIVGKKGTEGSQYKFESPPQSEIDESPFISNVTVNANPTPSSTPQWNTSWDSRNPFIFGHLSYIIGGLKVH